MRAVLTIWRENEIAAQRRSTMMSASTSHIGAKVQEGLRCCGGSFGEQAACERRGRDDRTARASARDGADGAALDVGDVGRRSPWRDPRSSRH